MDENGFTFFKEKNFGGEKWENKTPSRFINSYGSLGSLKVGRLTKVNSWGKNGTMVCFGAGEHTDITGFNIDFAQGINHDFNISIDIKFKHTIEGNAPGAYDLSVKPLQFENVVVRSGSADYVCVQVPSLNPSNSLIVTQLSARKVEWPYQYVMNGSIYFQFDVSNGTITYEKSEGFPSNADIVQDDAAGFTITLKSE